LALDARSLPVTRLRAELPGRPEPITYWTLLGGVVVPDASAFRMRRLAFAARREVADGMLVRVSSIDPVAERAYARQAVFVRDMVRAMNPEARAKVVGA
jgi:EpsI family protein